jgi:hypothetical protein
MRINFKRKKKRKQTKEYMIHTFVFYLPFPHTATILRVSAWMTNVGEDLSERQVEVRIKDI